MVIDKYLFILIIFSLLVGLGIQLWIGVSVSKIEKSFQALYEIRLQALKKLQRTP